MVLQTTFYLQFKQANPTCDVGQRAFERLKPWYIKALTDRNVCCCIYHVQMDLMRQGLNNLRDHLKGIHRIPYCACDCIVCRDEVADGDATCSAHTRVYQRVSALWTECVCPVSELEQWHQKPCLMGDCPDCGVKLLKLCPFELSSGGGVTVAWKCFENLEVGSTSNGEVRKRITEVHKQTEPGVFVRYLQSKVKVFIKHNFVASWQDQQCKEMMKNVPEGVVISHIDFAENYTFQIQNEVQSMYFFSSSITILVHISMQREASQDGEEGLIKKTTHYYLSDDKQHDSLFVQHCLMLHWK